RLGSDDGAEWGQERQRGKDALTNDRMLAHDREFFWCERTRLLEDIAGNPDLADVVEQRPILQQAQVIALQAEPAADVDRQLGGLTGVRFRISILGVQRGRERADRRHAAFLLLPAPGFV